MTAQLEGQRVSLTFSSNGLAQLWQEDSLLLQTTNTGAFGSINVIFTATHPYGGWNTSSNVPVDTGVSAGFDQNSTNTYQNTNASYAIIYAFEAAPAWLQARQQKLDAYRAQGLADSSRQVTTETLNVMGLDWMVQTELGEDLFSQEWGQLPQSHHRFGRMAQEAGRGYYVDAYLQLTGTFPNTGANNADFQNQNQVFDLNSYLGSAMEHGIIEQLQNSNLVAASTVKMLEIASTNSQAVYLAYSGNWSSVQSSLVNYSSGNLSALGNLISSGFILLLPQNGSNHVAGATSWAGDAYVQLGVGANGYRSMGMIIGGGYHGGYVSDPAANPNPIFIAGVNDGQPTFFDPQSPTLPFSGKTGADPVNLADGSFEITASDLSLGQTDPRGLNLTRYYLICPPKFQSGGHGPRLASQYSYYCNVLPTSAPEGSSWVAGRRRRDGSIDRGATWAALNLYNNQAPDPKNWMVTALIAKWAIDQTINNAVSVNLGNDTIQFLKQPGGLYTPPASSTMSLLATNGVFWLLERHGRIFKFGKIPIICLPISAIQYGQAMTLSYGFNNLASANVTDWKGRSLTFGYSGGEPDQRSRQHRTLGFLRIH